MKLLPSLEIACYMLGGCKAQEGTVKRTVELIAQGSAVLSFACLTTFNPHSTPAT